LAASSERDRSGERPARLAEAFHGAPYPGSGGGRLLPPLPLDQVGQRELLGGQQRLPVLRRPFLDSLDVAPDAVAACHGQRHAGPERDGQQRAEHEHQTPPPDGRRPAVPVQP